MDPLLNHTAIQAMKLSGICAARMSQEHDERPPRDYFHDFMAYLMQAENEGATHVRATCLDTAVEMRALKCERDLSWDRSSYAVITQARELEYMAGGHIRKIPIANQTLNTREA